VVGKGISLGFEQVGVYLIYRDITERKKAERELRRSEGYLAEAQKLDPYGQLGLECAYRRFSSGRGRFLTFML